MEPFSCALFPNPWTEDEDSSSSRTVWLQNWWLIKADKDFNGKTLAVQGSSSTGGQRRQVVRVFSSAPIVKRYGVFTIETADGISITLNGFINKVRTCENGFSTEVFSHFLFGFPLNWEECAERCFVADVIKKEGVGGKTCPSRIPTLFPLKKEGSHKFGGEGSHDHSGSMLDKKKSGHVHLASPSGALGSVLKYFRTRTRSGGLNNKVSAVRPSEYVTHDTEDATPTKLEITRENQKNNENEDLLPKQDMETRTLVDSIRMNISIKKEKKLGQFASVAPIKSESGRQNQEDNQKEDIVSKQHCKKKAGSSVRPGLEVFDFVDTDEKNLDLNASDDLNAAATDTDCRQNREGNQEEGQVSKSAMSSFWRTQATSKCTAAETASALIKKRKLEGKPTGEENQMRTSTVPPANGNECDMTNNFGYADAKKLGHNAPDALDATPTNGGTGTQNYKDQRDSHIKGRSMPCRPSSQRTDAKPTKNSKGRGRQQSDVKEKECSVALKVSDCKRSRSGRILLPSLEFWRNQIAIYDVDGQVTAIKEG